MRRKQLFAVLMAGSMAASLAACGKTDTKKTTAATEKKTEAATEKKTECADVSALKVPVRPPPFRAPWSSLKNATTAPRLLACQSKQKRAPDGDS